MLHYVFSLNYIKKKKKNVIMVSNNFLTKKFLNIKRKKNHGLIKHNKINTNNKLKVI
jgi:hypothetical protein